jgi:hypothetical protein
VPPGKFSPDGFWWWDGAAWKPAYSQDRLWRWNGASWVPAAGPPPRSSHTGLIVGLSIGAAFLLVVVIVAVIVAAVLYTSGAQIANVFSNVAAALGSPSP